MSGLLAIETLQVVAWLVGLLELVLALYILLLNSRHPANRHVSLLLFIFAVNDLAMGLLFGVKQAAEAVLPTLLLAMTSEPAKVGLLLTAIVLLKPQWMQGRRRWLEWLLHGLVFLPMVLTAIDAFWHTGLWYSGLDAASYTGGYVASGVYEAGSVARVVRPLYVYVLSLLPFVPILWTLISRKTPPATRQLAWMVLITQGVAVAVQFGLRAVIGSGATSIITTTFFAIGYAYTAFQQMISERRAQHGRLRPRLIALTLAIAIPILLALVTFVIFRSSKVIETQALETLSATNHLLATSVQLWLDYNTKALQQLVRQPEIQGMNPATQEPVLAAMDGVYEHIYLVSTTDLTGMNVARSDGAALIDYSDRAWFQEVRDGAPYAYQVVISRTSGKPALVVSMPIRNSAGELVGVGMFGANLDQLSNEVAVARFGNTGVTYVVDAEDRIIAHPDPAFSVEIVSIHDTTLAQKLREGREKQFIYTDVEGRKWEVYVDVLANGWGIIAQQQYTEWRGPVLQLARTGVLLLILGAGLLGGLTFFTMRQAFEPIDALTTTAAAIAKGDLTRTAPVVSEDELGGLARVFNSMTAQLRESIDTLEQRVASRTLDLQRRSAYLAASAEVSRAAVSMLDPDVLIHQVVDLIRERFDLYYVGLFLVDETTTWAVLRSGTGTAGAAMLARQHRIRIGEGMIGWSIANAEARVASHAEVDDVRLVNPELPDTRSEAALPLRSRGQVLGALSVQSTYPDAFDAESVSVLQTMVDQVAVAIDNARLLAQAQTALEAERRAYGLASRQDWSRLARARAESGYVGVRQTVEATSDTKEVALLVAQGEWSPEMRAAQRARQSVAGQQDGMPTLAVPILVRDEVVGVLNFSKGEGATGLTSGGTWTRDEITLLEALAGQLGQALDAARLYRQTQLRVAREGAIRAISDQIQRAPDITSLMRITAEALNQALGGSRVYVRLGADIGGDAHAVTGAQTDGGDNGDAK
ncbi:MAG TPA: cache domain-containing protein [Anaerolineae bacterium]|nr:cache domain-containing protein [Anaerolineae bacterium]HQI83969.1 cache domain-containing protein [Anaerolineae bacterium]